MIAMAARITVRVHPGARREGLRGRLADGALKVDVSAPPEDGRANAAVCALIALAVAIPSTRLEGFYLALATLALAQLFIVVLNEGGEVTGGTGGLVDYRLPDVFERHRERLRRGGLHGHFRRRKAVESRAFLLRRAAGGHERGERQR